MKFAYWFSDLLKKVAGVCLVAMMALTVADVIGSLFGAPILGSEEMVGLIAALLLACALPATEMEKGHIGVDLLIMHAPKRFRRVNDLILSVLEVALFSLVAWQLFSYATKLRTVGQVSATLQFPTYYLIYGVALSFVVLAAVILVEIFLPRQESKDA
jgi:C4-dicarboxylate transporter, DctQ subunit